MENSILQKAVSLQKDIKELKEKIDNLDVKSRKDGSKLRFKSVYLEVVFDYEPTAYNSSVSTAKKNVVIDRKMAEHLYFQYKNDLMAKLHKLETEFNHL